MNDNSSEDLIDYTEERKSYGILSNAIAFEVPFIDFNSLNSDDYNKLATDLTDSYLDWFEVLSNDIQLLERSPKNYIFLHSMVIRADYKSIGYYEVKSQWDELKIKMEKLLSNYLSSMNIEYKLI